METMLAKNIKNYREKFKLSQEDLARRANINYSTLRKIETGIIDNPTLDKVVKLSNMFNVTLDELVGRKRHKKNPIKVEKGTIRVSELFAGVGGFRLGLKEPDYKVVWSNQWEPSTKLQHASDVYVARFGKEGHSNEDIAAINVNNIPDHDLLVGGFPCQDYSVARTLSQAAGIMGKKGVLWWHIHRILDQKKRKPKYLMLENVDRLLKSPASQRGRDFAIMLASLSDLGYAVEWRMINAADYGMPQRRRRVYILGYYRNTQIYKNISKGMDLSSWMYRDGVMSKAFPVEARQESMSSEFHLNGSPEDLTEQFNNGRSLATPFDNAGVMIKRTVFSEKTIPKYYGKRIVLKDVLLPENQVPESFFINEDDLPTWQYLKGPKNEVRVNKNNGFEYKYTEGGMVFPDSLDKPSRTIVTAEGGSTPSRFKHVVKTKNERLRRLTPVELERLNMFPNDHTAGQGDAKRAFFMGNALVVGVIEKIGKQLIKDL